MVRERGRRKRRDSETTGETKIERKREIEYCRYLSNYKKGWMQPDICRRDITLLIHRYRLTRLSLAGSVAGGVGAGVVDGASPLSSREGAGWGCWEVVGASVGVSCSSVGVSCSSGSWYKSHVPVRDFAKRFFSHFVKSC